MKIEQALARLGERKDLPADLMADAMREIMAGDATPAQIGGLLMGLRVKGETVEEIAAAAGVMRELAVTINVPCRHLIDTCGTGGDGAGLFNVSTACAFVAAEAGALVAKHGNRSVSSKSGSADVLEKAGVAIDLSPERVTECIEKHNVGFLFAPAHHQATRHAVGPRKELGLRTMFNLLGPLTNPALAPRQVMGVFSPRWPEPIAEVLKQLGSAHVMVVHSDDGLDELSIAAPTQVAELKDGRVSPWTLKPETYGIDRQSMQSLVVNDADQSLALIKSALSGEPGPAHDIVALNSGAAIYVAGLAEDMQGGVDQARQILASGRALERMQALATETQR